MTSQNPFAPRVPFSYPRSDAGVTLTENTSLKITHPSGQFNARMGTSLALSGDGTKLIVGMPDGSHEEDDLFQWPPGTGRVQAYTKTNNTWTPNGPIPWHDLGSFEDVTGDENIGRYVAMSRDGGTIASSNLLTNMVGVIGLGGLPFFGIPTDNTPGPLALNGSGSRIVIGMPLGATTNQGRVTVYGLRLAVPGEFGSHYPIGNSLTGTAHNDNFGSEVCINDVGDIIGVGIPGSDTVGNNLGAVKVYKLIGTTWTQIGQTLDLFSEQKVTSLAMNSAGDIICIGSAFNQPFPTSEPYGEVSVYKFDGSHWNLLGHKLVNFFTVNAQIGHAVAISSDGYTIVASNGASTLTSSSYNETVSVFRYNGFDWKLVGSFVGPSNTAQNGYSLAISSDGKTIIAGAPGTNSNRGEVRYFTLNV